MKKLELSAYGLVELHPNDLEINGGGWPKWLKKLSWAYVAEEIITNWEVIKKGLKEGWDVEHHH
ncbi:MAG: hypothetical protein ACRCSM_08740 [Sediminibacterium sp.]|jgi:hypothetical protein|uniref:hypothetical protein n=1 Tax=Enterococcus faecium TaxID=1352 RepID=UPI003AB000AC|nr:hypothetical protein [Chitinophagaceae bacterium]MCA6447241.1 hypothetical protein [Chitinophagaceae bacterium]